MIPNTENKPMVENISCIIPQTSQLGGLFLGNVYGAQNAAILKQYGIRAVITTSAQTNISYSFEDIPFHMVFDGHDKEDYYISQHVNSCIHFIEQHRKFTNVFVHCFAGVSRSSAIVCSYLMWKYRWTLNKTLKFVVFKRVVAKPNDGFMKQLKDVEIKLNISQEENTSQQRNNVQRILSPNGSRVRQESLHSQSQSRPGSSRQIPVHIQKPQSPPLCQPQKIQPFAQINKMSMQQQQFSPQQYPPQTHASAGKATYNDYGGYYQNGQEQSSEGLERTLYNRTKTNHGQIPIPKVIGRKSQYEKIQPRQEAKRNSIYNDYNGYASPPMSPRNRFSQNMSLGKTNNLNGLGSPTKTYQQMNGNNYRQNQASVYSTNYSKKTYDSLEKSKTVSRCMIRPRDLPGYNRSNFKNY